MGEPKAVGLAAAAYAAALRAAVHGFTMQGGTQKEIAVAAHVAPATLSRYLSGDRVAPPTFVARLDSFLAERAGPWTPECGSGLTSCAPGPMRPAGHRPSSW